MDGTAEAEPVKPEVTVGAGGMITPSLSTDKASSANRGTELVPSTPSCPIGGTAVESCSRVGSLARSGIEETKVGFAGIAGSYGSSDPTSSLGEMMVSDVNAEVAACAVGSCSSTDSTIEAELDVEVARGGCGPAELMLPEPSDDQLEGVG